MTPESLPRRPYPEAEGNQAALSEAGQARRDAMLLELKALMARRKRWRRVVRHGAVRHGAAAALVIVLSALCFWSLRTGEVSRPGAPETAAPEPWFPPAGLQVITNDPGILSQIVRNAPVNPDVFLNDEALLVLLSEARQPAGLIRVNGKAILVEY